MPFAAIVQRIQSFSLSIGQLTFASFMLLLAMIVMTSVASVVSIRHIDATFAELQRLQSLGDLAGDRPPHERIAACGEGLCDRSGGSVQPGLGGGFLAEQSLEENTAAASPRSAGNDRRRLRAAPELPRRHRARYHIDRAPGGTGRRVAAGAPAFRSGNRRSA